MGVPGHTFPVLSTSRGCLDTHSPCSPPARLHQGQRPIQMSLECAKETNHKEMGLFNVCFLCHSFLDRVFPFIPKKWQALLTL